VKSVGSHLAASFPMRLAARAVARRSLCAIALTSLVNRKLPAHALGENAGNLQAPPEYFGTKTGLTYFDKKIFFGNGFEDRPCESGCLTRVWTPDPTSVLPAPTNAAPLLADGQETAVQYRVRRGFFNGELVALSDGPLNGGDVQWIVGDGTVNAAVDELVRSLPKGTVRRAIVPAAFDLDRGTRSEYPVAQPPGITYLELTLRKLSASSPVGVCPGGDERYNKVSTCLCGRGPTSAGILDGYQF